MISNLLFPLLLNENFTATDNELNELTRGPWIPVKFNEGNTPILEWCLLDQERFTDPFFSDTLIKLSRRTGKQSVKTEVTTNVFNNLTLDSIKPAGFIFHTSRCGSTLISQLFSVLPQCRVLSEPPIIDSFLYWLHNDSNLSHDKKIFLFQKLISFLGRKTSDSEKHLLIKFDCWHIEYYRFIKESFPDVPSIFVYRLPIEVIESHLRIKGMQMIPGLVKSKLLEINEPVSTAVDLNMYLAQVLKQIFQHAADEFILDDMLLINYNSLPSIFWTTLLDYFNISHSADDIEVIKHRSKFDAKNINLEFKREGFKTEPPIPEHLKTDLSKKLNPLYERLEKIRMKQKKQI